MYIKPTLEWWKLRISQDVSEYLGNPDTRNHAKLIAALETYQSFYLQHKPDAVTAYDDYERLIGA